MGIVDQKRINLSTFLSDTAKRICSVCPYIIRCSVRSSGRPIGLASRRRSAQLTAQKSREAMPKNSTAGDRARRHDPMHKPPREDRANRPAPVRHRPRPPLPLVRREVAESDVLEQQLGRSIRRESSQLPQVGCALTNDGFREVVGPGARRAGWGVRLEDAREDAGERLGSAAAHPLARGSCHVRYNVQPSRRMDGNMWTLAISQCTQGRRA